MFEKLGLRSSSTIILLIPLAFIVGAIASESLAFAAKETMGKPFLEIWDAMPNIYTIENDPDTVVVPPLKAYDVQLTCAPGDIIIGTDFDTDVGVFIPEIDIKNQIFSVTGFNTDIMSSKELHMSLSCLGV